MAWNLLIFDGKISKTDKKGKNYQVPLSTLLAFIFLGAAFLSLWIKRDPKIWGTLAAVAVVLGYLAVNITWIGLFLICLLALLWFLYYRRPKVILFAALVLMGICFKLRILPGYYPFFITPKFALGLANPLIGLFPLALLVPLAQNLKDWAGVMKGVAVGCVGIVILAGLAVITGATHFDYKIPSFFFERTLSNLFLTSIPEEGFYRGFIQNTLSGYFKNTRWGNAVALIVSALLFSISHIYWSPNLGILAFTFLTGLLYGGVYLYSRKIESAILCHFLFNLVHMMFFSYHAM